MNKELLGGIDIMRKIGVGDVARGIRASQTDDHQTLARLAEKHSKFVDHPFVKGLVETHAKEHGIDITHDEISKLAKGFKASEHGSPEAFANYVKSKGFGEDKIAKLQGAMSNPENMAALTDMHKMVNPTIANALGAKGDMLKGQFDTGTNALAKGAMAAIGGPMGAMNAAASSVGTKAANAVQGVQDMRANRREEKNAAIQQVCDIVKSVEGTIKTVFEGSLQKFLESQLKTDGVLGNKLVKLSQDVITYQIQSTLLDDYFVQHQMVIILYNDIGSGIVNNYLEGEKIKSSDDLSKISSGKILDYLLDELKDRQKKAVGGPGTPIAVLPAPTNNASAPTTVPTTAPTTVPGPATNTTPLPVPTDPTNTAPLTDPTNTAPLTDHLLTAPLLTDTASTAENAIPTDTAPTAENAGATNTAPTPTAVPANTDVKNGGSNIFQKGGKAETPTNIDELLEFFPLDTDKTELNHKMVYIVEQSITNVVRETLESQNIKDTIDTKIAEQVESYMKEIITKFTGTDTGKETSKLKEMMLLTLLRKGLFRRRFRNAIEEAIKSSKEEAKIRPGESDDILINNINKQVKIFFSGKKQGGNTQVPTNSSVIGNAINNLIHGGRNSSELRSSEFLTNPTRLRPSGFASKTKGRKTNIRKTKRHKPNGRKTKGHKPKRRLSRRL